MHISKRMTIHFFLNGVLSCTFIYEWLPFLFLMGFSHAHFCTNDYHFFFWIGFRHAHFCTNNYHFFLNGFSSCTFLYEWLPFLCIRVFVMHISVRMTFNILLICHVCYALQRVNSMVQWRIINDTIMYIGFDHVCNALQRVNSMVQWRIINDIIMYIGFEFFLT